MPRKPSFPPRPASTGNRSLIWAPRNRFQPLRRVVQFQDSFLARLACFTLSTPSLILLTISSHLTAIIPSHLSLIPTRSADTNLRYPKLTASRYLPYSQPLPAQPQQKCRRISKPSISNRSPRSQWVRICAMATPRISSPSSLYVNTAFLNNPRCPC